MNDPLHILLIDDNPDDRTLISRVLHREFPDIHIEQIGNAASLAEALQHHTFDLVITDYHLRWTDGLAVLRSAKARYPDCPVIMFTATGSEEIAVEAMKAGLDDYVLKTPRHFVRLPAAVRSALEQARQRQALKEAETRYRNLFERVPVGLYRIAPDGQILDANPAMVQMLGYPDRETLLEVNAAVFYVEPDARAQWKTLAERDEIVRRMEAQARRRDGTIIWVQHSARAIRDAEGQVLYYEGSVEDITARKQRERELEAIVMVAAALRAASARADMLPVILGQLLELLQAEGAALAMEDPISGEMVIELARGAWATWTGERLPPGEGISGHVMATGQPYVNDDVLADPLIARPQLPGDVRAVACAPLIAHTQPIGALWVGRHTPFGAGEVRLLTAVADMAASAIHRASLHEQTEQHVRRLSALRTIDVAITASLDRNVTLNVLLEQLTNYLNADAADILLLRPHTHSLEYATGRGFRTQAIRRTRVRLGESLAGRAVLERRVIRIPDLGASEEPFRRTSLLAAEAFIGYYVAPLIVKGQVKGVLELFHRSRLDHDTEWSSFLEAMAAQAAIAIDNAELFTNLQRSNTELILAYDTTLEGWATALEMRDYETEGHSRRVTEMTVRLARAMGMSDEELVHIRRGALLHDIGKMGLPDRILFKPGELTDEEGDIVRKHPVHAYKMLLPIGFLRPALDIPYCHHERWDGTGYPRGLAGGRIPLAARIFAVVDTYDALSSDRPYRPAWPEEQVRQHIREQAGKHFDPQVVDAFFKVLEP